MPNRHKIKVEIIVDEDAYVDYVEHQVQSFVYNNPYITSASIRYYDEEITEREKFVNSRGYQESIIDNPHFTTGNAVSLNKEFKELQGKEVCNIYDESKSYGKLLDIVADRDDFYYVTEKCWVSCVIGLKEYKNENIN
jgi:hypothetical protein